MPTKVRESICYKRNFLTSVIARIDFPVPIAQVSKGLPKDLYKSIMEMFPIPEPKQILAQEMQISNFQVKQKQISHGVEWNFHGNEKEKTLTISPSSLLVNWSVYKSYENLKMEFLATAIKFLDHFKDTQVSRIGLRAINEIVIDEINPLDWSKYINKNLLHHFKFGTDSASLSRVFHNLEYNFNDFNLRFQFGMHNPDYPAKIAKKSICP